MTDAGLMYDVTMTDKHAPVEAPPFDIGNRLLSPQTCDITVMPADTPVGSRMILTIRTPSSTTTAFLTKEEALAVGRQLIRRAQEISSLIVPTSVTPRFPPPVGT